VLIILLLAGCTVKNYTPEIPYDLSQQATVTSGDFSFDCEFCRKDGVITVRVLSTRAKGLTMSYDGVSLVFDYDGMPLDLAGANFEKTNPAIMLYDVFSSLEELTPDSVSRLENGFCYRGATALGDYVLIQNDSGSLVSLTFRSSDISVKFR
jgi:hypothetical protein